LAHKKKPPQGGFFFRLSDAALRSIRGAGSTDIVGQHLDDALRGG
jgi:hypothetical protein